MLILITALWEGGLAFYWNAVINYSDEDLYYEQFKFLLFKNIINETVKNFS